MSCTASTEHNSQYLCGNALDGNDNTQWAPREVPLGVGAWINVNFNEEFSISKIRLKNRYGGIHNENFENIRLDFSNGYSTTATLQDAVDWNEVLINPTVTATSVLITAETVYGTGHNGFSEAQFFGCG